MIEISDIKGISIFHKTLGEGRVVDLKKDLLYIQFDDQVKGFKLPLALEGIQAPLKSDNILINDLVNQIKTQNLTCCLCGKTAPLIKEYKEQRLCNDCYTTAKKCKICGRRVNEELVSFVEAEMCDACFLERYFKCDVCGEYNSKWDEAESSIIPKGEHWCRYCIDTCYVCEREIKLDRTTIYNLNYYPYHICTDCQKTHIKKCRKCKTEFLAKESADQLCDDCSAVVSFVDFLKDYDMSELLYLSLDFYDFAESSTVKLMSRLNGSCIEDPFDILFISNFFGEKIVVVSEGSKLYHYKVINNYHSSCTLTEFKKSRLFYELIDKKMSKLCSVNWTDNEVIDIWKEPVHLRAQTYADMDYRKEWEGGDIVYEGNNYGDTSDFYIIGKVRSLRKNNR